MKIDMCTDSNGWAYLSIGNIFSVGHTKKGVWIEENCDMYYKEELTTDEAIRMFQDCINFIKEDKK